MQKSVTKKNFCFELFTLSNGLSLLRCPLAFLFLIDRTEIRAAAIVLAGLTDCIDGYLARRRRSTTMIGAILDPLMDKFFVFFVLKILFFENRLNFFGLMALLARDLSLCLFTLYMIIGNRWREYLYRSPIVGKVTTFLQFVVLLALVLQIKVASFFFGFFFMLGGAILIELFFHLKINSEKIYP